MPRCGRECGTTLLIRSSLPGWKLLTWRTVRVVSVPTPRLLFLLLFGFGHFPRFFLCQSGLLHEPQIPVLLPLFLSLIPTMPVLGLTPHHTMLKLLLLLVWPHASAAITTVHCGLSLRALPVLRILHLPDARALPRRIQLQVIPFLVRVFVVRQTRRLLAR